MIQKHRISTNIGKDQKITVELKQDFDVLEILSLKFSQQDIYTSMCSDYGVVCGRITANDGFGIPNVRVSIFVKQKDSDVNDPVISKLYPYTDTTMRNDDNIRYNLLPKRQQHGGHTPVGTFPDQSDILTREEVLEVYESYYRFTVKTNESGDFMIWGVPTGEQTLHVDVDLSDIGCFSLRPYDFIKKGRGVDEFDRYYKFKSSTDIDGLPQIISYDKIIQVYPFWGNEEMCEIGITRTDFDISETGIKIEPISLILASSITDDDSDAVKRSGVIRRKTGYKCNLQTTTGKIECVRQTGRKVYGSDGVTLYPELQYFNITETINENGAAMIVLPMNLEYVYTNEFGEQELTNDHNKGIPTTAIARFRFSLDANGVKTGTANYLIPQIREFNDDLTNGGNYYGEYEESFLTTYQFSNVFEDYLKIAPQSGMTFQAMGNSGTNQNDPKAVAWRQHKLDLMLGTYNDGIPEDVFYKFIFGKVYTPSSFQGSHYEVSAVESFLGLSRRDAFLGIKEIRPNVEDDCTSSANYIPTNFAFRNRIKFGLIISEILLFLQYIFTLAYIWLIEIIGSTLWSVARYIGPKDYWFANHPFEDIAYNFVRLAYNITEAGQTTLPLTTYPDCEECTTDIDTADPSNNSVFNIEEGCKKYDKFYNESIVYSYIWSDNGSYGTNDSPSNTGNKSGPDGYPSEGGLNNRIRATYNYSATNNPWFLLGKPHYEDTPHLKEQLTSPGAGWTIVATIIGAPGSTVSFGSGQYAVSTFNTTTRRLPNRVHTENGIANYNKKTKSGLTEIRDGVITIVPVVDGPSNSIAAIQEWYRRKRVGVFFCGGVTNYSFIDNWLHGVLYFFKFDKKIKWDNRSVRDLNQRGSKFPRELVFFNVLDEAFYYRSTPYNPNAGFLGQIYRNGDNSVKYKEILHPTTFYDVGVRDEFLYEICQDPRIDPTCSVIRDVTTTSYQDPANVVEHAINYRLDISDAKFDVGDFFTGQGLGDNVGVFDGDITQLMSINCEAGIEAFDLDSPQYFLYNGELMDPEDTYFASYFKPTGTYGPLPIDLKLDTNGAFIRQCLNFRLGDYSQKVPFFLWDKLGTGFGLYNGDYSDKQGWDRKEIASMKLQRLFSISDKSSTTTNYVMADGEEEYLLKPITITHDTFSFTGNTTNALERYEVVSLSAPTSSNPDLYTYSGATDYVEGDLWLHVQSGTTKDPSSGTTYVVVWDSGLGKQRWTAQSDTYVKDYRESFIYQTINNYTGTKQVLSTPFLFYFGLRPQNSAVDLLIKYYGPKGAFPSAE